MNPGPDGNSSAFPGEDPRDHNLPAMKRTKVEALFVKHEDN